MSEENDQHAVDPLAEHDRPWHTHNAWDNHGGDAIDRAERAFWDGIDYSKLGEAEAAEDGAGS